MFNMFFYNLNQMSIVDKAKELEIISNLNPNVLNKINKLEYVKKYRKEFSKNPNSNQKNICKKIGISQATLSRYTKDL